MCWLLLCIWELLCTESKCIGWRGSKGAAWGGGDFLIIFLCVFDTREGYFPRGRSSGPCCPLLLLPCCSIISPSLHLILRQQGGLRQAMTGRKQKAIWPDGGMEDEVGVEGEMQGWSTWLWSPLVCFLIPPMLTKYSCETTNLIYSFSLVWFCGFPCRNLCM